MLISQKWLESLLNNAGNPDWSVPALSLIHI